MKGKNRGTRGRRKATVLERNSDFCFHKDMETGPLAKISRARRECQSMVLRASIFRFCAPGTAIVAEVVTHKDFDAR
jgi:hypothetical protein